MKNVIQSILGTFFFASLAVPVWSLPTDGMAASLREASVESTLEGDKSFACSFGIRY